MEQLALNTKRKDVIVKIGIGLLGILILLTFLSKTINGLLMPKVTVSSVVKGSLQENLETEGIIELQNKYKIIATNSWKVKEVAVRANQQVKKGDLLAVIDNTDDELNLKRKELEILKLENIIESMKQNYKSTQLSDFEREVQVAKADVDYAKKNLDIITELLESGAETQSNYESAERKYEDTLYIYQTKQKILIEMPKELINKKDQQDRSIKEKKVELDIKKAEYEVEESSMYVNGKILSESDGVVSAINIEAGMTAIPNQTIIEIVNENSTYNVVWYLMPEKAAKYEIGQDITVTGKGISQKSENKDDDKGQQIKNYNLSLKIGGKESTPDKSQIKFWTKISKEKTSEAQVLLNEGDKANVQATINSDIYNYLLPKGAITQKEATSYIFVVNESKGALGTMNIVEEREIKILDENDFKVAVNGFIRNTDKIVVNTTKPLKDRIQVQVR